MEKSTLDSLGGIVSYAFSSVWKACRISAPIAIALQAAEGEGRGILLLQLATVGVHHLLLILQAKASKGIS